MKTYTVQFIVEFAVFILLSKMEPTVLNWIIMIVDLSALSYTLVMFDKDTKTKE